MLAFQGQLQVPLLRDPSEARLAPEPATGGHPVHGHAAAARTSEAEVGDQGRGRPEEGHGTWVPLGGTQRGACQTVNAPIRGDFHHTAGK